MTSVHYFLRSGGKPCMPPGFLRTWLTALAILACLPVLKAGEADGIYKPVELKGHVKFLGKRIDLPVKTLRDVLLKDGLLPVMDNRVPIQANRWGRILEDLSLMNIHGKTSSHGPAFLRLHKTHRGFAGEAGTPVKAQLKGRKHFVTVKVSMNGKVRAKVIGDDLTLEAPIRITILGIKADGKMYLEAHRMPPPAGLP